MSSLMSYFANPWEEGVLGKQYESRKFYNWA